MRSIEFLDQKLSVVPVCYIGLQDRQADANFTLFTALKKTILTLLAILPLEEEEEVPLMIILTGLAFFLALCGTSVTSWILEAQIS